MAGEHEEQVVGEFTKTFGDRAFRFRHVVTASLPNVSQVATAMGLAFYDGKLVLVEHAKYGGLQPPGGHLEAGETPDDAVRREVLEEAAAEVGACVLVGYEEITPLFDVPADYRYSVPSYQVFYACRIDRLLTFYPNAESLGRKLLEPGEARVWAGDEPHFYERALGVAQTFAP